MNLPTPDLSGKLATIGDNLRQKRLEKGLTLQEVYYGTLIPEKHLQAIETGNVDALPETIYVQGFIRKYALFVGAHDLIEELPVVKINPSSSWSSLPRFPIGAWHFYFLYILVVAGSVSALATSLAVNPYSIDDSVDSSVNVSVVPSPTPSPKGFPFPTAPSTDSSTPVMPTKVNLSITMVGESWMRVTVDDKVEFEGILSEGKSVTWSGQKQILLRVGNGSAVSFSYNQSPSQVLGNEGEVVEKAFGSSL